MNHDRPFAMQPHRILGRLGHMLFGALILASLTSRAQALEWMYVSNPREMRVDRFAMDGSSLGSIAVDRYEPYGVAVDSRGDVFVSDIADGRILRYDAAGDPLGNSRRG